MGGESAGFNLNDFNSQQRQQRRESKPKEIKFFFTPKKKYQVDLQRVLYTQYHKDLHSGSRQERLPHLVNAEAFFA